jgi:hypothetical protein
LRGGRHGVLAVVVTAAAIAGSDLSAHRRDEYLQAARLSVEPGRVEVELDLTPGLAIADTTIADLDRDYDGVLSEQEQRAYSGRVMGEVVLALDGRALQVESIAATFPPLNDFRRGEGTIQIHATAALPKQADGDHQLSFRNASQQEGSVYLANALVPTTDRVTITAQRRDPLQRELTVEYVLRGGSPTSAPTWLMGGLMVMTVLAVVLVRSKSP